MTLFGKPGDQEDGRLMSQNNHLITVWMSGSLIDQRWGWGAGVKKQNKKAINLANTWNAKSRGGDVFISSFLQPLTGGRGPEWRHYGLTFKQMGRVPQGRPVYINSVLLVNKSNQEAKVKETVLTWSQN